MRGKVRGYFARVEARSLGEGVELLGGRVVGGTVSNLVAVGDGDRHNPSNNYSSIIFRNHMEKSPYKEI